MLMPPAQKASVEAVAIHAIAITMDAASETNVRFGMLITFLGLISGKACQIRSFEFDVDQPAGTAVLENPIANETCARWGA
jgi:hypothetical protein